MASSSPLRPLLPKSKYSYRNLRHDDPPMDPQSESTQRPKRTAIVTACLECRNRKLKCNGERPTCSRCAKGGWECFYDVELEPGETTRAMALKRRYQTSQRENADLRELYDHLRLRPLAEAAEIFQRLRETSDPFRLLELLRHGDMNEHLQAESAGTNAGIISSAAVQRLDREALEESTIKLPARPWTRLGGDGIVSLLVSTFLEWDAAFYFQFMDDECFIADMRRGDPVTAKYCSPLLVNAACSLKCHTLEKAKTLGVLLRCDMSVEFLNEAKIHLDQENGKPSLPTIQALIIMFICSAGIGRDRAGVIYRYMAYDMFKRLALEKQFSNKCGEGDSKEQRDAQALSRAIWGIYAFESICEFAYLKPSLIKMPSIPRTFLDIKVTKNVYKSYDINMSSLILSSTCDAAGILDKAMTYNSKGVYPLGSEKDIQARISFYQELQTYRKYLPEQVRMEINFCPPTFMLSTLEDQATLGIFRPLDPKTFISPSLGLAEDICILHCKHSILAVETFERAWPLAKNPYSIVVLFPLYNASVTLVHLLRNPASHNTFTTSCRILSQTSVDFPFSSYLLRALKGIADKMNMPIPPRARQYLEGAHLDPSDLQDVPILFVLPTHEKMLTLLNEDNHATETEEMGMQLGTVITKWSALSL